MNTHEPEEWWVELTLNYNARTYTVLRVAKKAAYPYTPEHRFTAVGQDELSAFNSAQKALKGLGFTAADLT